MSPINDDMQTLTKVDMNTIRMIIREEVGTDLAMVKQELLGPPPEHSQGIKKSVSLVWTKVNSLSTWRTLVTGGLIVINLLLLVFGAALLSKIDDVLTMAAVAKADRETIQRNLDKAQLQHKP